MSASEGLLGSVAARKGARRVSICLPCRNEQETVGIVVAALKAETMDSIGLVDELIVIDDGSTDETAARAAAAGARVVPISEVHRRFGEGAGKGNVLWASLLVSEGDFVVWLDADVTTATPEWVAQLLEPLLDDPRVALVKASYERPTDSGGGGRTTELVVRPLLSLLAPQLSWIDQPLAGEMAVRRDLIETIPLAQGWGVEIAMILDLAERYGAASIAQVHLGVRRHRHRDLMDLRVQAAEVMATLLGRLGIATAEPDPQLRLPDGTPLALNLDERPPAALARNA